MFKKILLLTSFTAILFAAFNFSNVSVQAFGTNITDEIKVEIQTREDDYLLTYTITQTFNEESRGVFLSLPNNQDGVWVDYNLISVQKSNLIKEANNFFTFKDTSQTVVTESNLDGPGVPLQTAELPSLEDNNQAEQSVTFEDETYNQIHEWNEFRVRVGNKDKILPRGQYIYKIQLEASRNKDYKHDFTLIYDWTDPVTNISVVADGRELCTGVLTCSASKTVFELNPSKNEAPLYHRIFNNLWIYLITLPLISGLILILWYFFARDPSSGFKVDKPEFEPPKELYPWQAQFLINEGSVSFKETFLSYILWLNNQKYIKITSNNHQKKPKDKITIEILKTLPKDVLPIFNKAITKMPEKGIEKAIYDSKINQGQDGGKLHKHIYDSLKKYYIQKPLYSPTAITLILGFVVFFAGIFGFQFLQETFLVGNSWVPVLIISLIYSVIPTWWLLRMWGKLSRKGYNLRAYCQRYKFYLEKAEKFKLDFSNNPKEGVQFYLKSVPFAASFLILPQFQKYMHSIMPNVSEIDSNTALRSTFYATRFYTPPSSSSGGSSGGGGGGFSGGGGSW
jgi:uncharacterized membrane protein YgcG